MALDVSLHICANMIDDSFSVCKIWMYILPPYWKCYHHFIAHKIARPLMDSSARKLALHIVLSRLTLLLVWLYIPLPGCVHFWIGWKLKPKPNLCTSTSMLIVQGIICASSNQTIQSKNPTQCFLISVYYELTYISTVTQH